METFKVACEILGVWIIKNKNSAYGLPTWSSWIDDFALAHWLTQWKPSVTSVVLHFENVIIDWLFHFGHLMSKQYTLPWLSQNSCLNYMVKICTFTFNVLAGNASSLCPRKTLSLSSFLFCFLLFFLFLLSLGT